MIGLPGETDADVTAIADTVMWLQSECRGRRGGKDRLRVSVTISNFTPKPHTPFQWHTVSSQEFERKQRLLKDRFREARDVKACSLERSRLRSSKRASLPRCREVKFLSPPRFPRRPGVSAR